MVLHDIAQGADLVVERSAVLDPEAFGHRDLDGFDVLTPPQRLQPRIGEAHVDDVLHRLLAQVVVDAQDLVFPQDRMQPIIEFARGLKARAEGLFYGDSAT